MKPVTGNPFSLIDNNPLTFFTALASTVVTIVGPALLFAHDHHVAGFLTMGLVIPAWGAAMVLLHRLAFRRAAAVSAYLRSIGFSRGSLAGSDSDEIYILNNGGVFVPETFELRHGGAVLIVNLRCMGWPSMHACLKLVGQVSGLRLSLSESRISWLLLPLPLQRRLIDRYVTSVYGLGAAFPRGD